MKFLNHWFKKESLTWRQDRLQSGLNKMLVRMGELSGKERRNVIRLSSCERLKSIYKRLSSLGTVTQSCRSLSFVLILHRLSHGRLPCQGEGIHPSGTVSPILCLIKTRCHLVKFLKLLLNTCATVAISHSSAKYLMGRFL